MRYMVRKSIVEFVGVIWLPGIECGQCLTLDSRDVEQCRDEDGKITRDSVEQWLATHSVDFSHVYDFHASIEDGEETIEIPWASEENELKYMDCMYPSED